MMIRCQYLRDTGFRDGLSWPDGTILQFLYASHGHAYAVVLPDNNEIPVLIDLDNVRIPKASVVSSTHQPGEGS
jgi:hypothetical protein